MKRSKEYRILSLITAIRVSHSAMSDIFTKGSCLNFFYILREVFPKAKPYYNFQHIVTKIGKKLYDINGVVHDPKKKYLPLGKCLNKKKLRRAFVQMLNEEFVLVTLELYRQGDKKRFAPKAKSK